MSNLQIEHIETKRLSFDPDNPRFYRLGRELGAEETVSEMLEYEGLADLMTSIGVKGYFAGEPLLVVEEDGQHIVIEGNRRLAAVKLLNGEFNAPSRKKIMVERIIDESFEKPTSLPCVNCEDRNEVLQYLGFRHVTGVKEWDSLSKALYVEKLLDDDVTSTDYKEKLNQIRKKIGTSLEYLARLMVALRVYQIAKRSRFFDLPMRAENVEFSLITTSLSYSDIRSWLGLEDLYADIGRQIKVEHLKLMFKFLFVVRSDSTTIIRESRQLREFSYIVRSEQAVAVLNETGNVEAASYMTEGPSEALLKLLERSSGYLQQAWNYLGEGKMVEIPDSHVDVVKQISNQADRLLDAMERDPKKGS